MTAPAAAQRAWVAAGIVPATKESNVPRFKNYDEIQPGVLVSFDDAPGSTLYRVTSRTGTDIKARDVNDFDGPIEEADVAMCRVPSQDQLDSIQTT